MVVVVLGGGGGVGGWCVCVCVCRALLFTFVLVLQQKITDFQFIQLVQKQCLFSLSICQSVSPLSSLSLLLLEWRTGICEICLSRSSVRIDAYYS